MKLQNQEVQKVSKMETPYTGYVFLSDSATSRLLLLIIASCATNRPMRIQPRLAARYYSTAYLLLSEVGLIYGVYDIFFCFLFCF